MDLSSKTKREGVIGGCTLEFPEKKPYNLSANGWYHMLRGENVLLPPNWDQSLYPPTLVVSFFGQNAPALTT